MANFVIDNEIKGWFEHYRNFCEFMTDADYESDFQPGLSLEQIEKWEQENDVELPHQYKSWLMLTGGADILNSELELYAPEIGTLDEADDIVIIGTAGDGSEAGMADMAVMILWYAVSYLSSASSCILYRPLSENRKRLDILSRIILAPAVMFVVITATYLSWHIFSTAGI